MFKGSSPTSIMSLLLLEECGRPVDPRHKINSFQIRNILIEMEAAFASVCEAFYLHKDEDAKDILDIYENSKLLSVKMHKGGVNLVSQSTEEAVTQDHVDVIDTEDLLPNVSKHHAKLLHLGFICTGEHAYYLLSERLQSYESIKNRVRQEAHSRRLQQHTDVLHALIHESTTSSNNIQPPTLPPVATVADELNNFLAKYLNDISCHSFLSGLRLLFERQRRSSKVMIWYLYDEAFIATSASEDEVRDKMYLLINVLILQPSSDLTSGYNANEVVVHTNRDVEAGNTNEDAQYRMWKMPFNYSDRRLDTIIRLLPPSKRFECNPAGRIVESVESRRVLNEEREIPLQRNKLCACLHFCNIL